MLSIVILSVSLSFYIMNDSYSKDSNSETKYNGSDSVIIIQLENNWAKALIKKDEEAFKKYLAADFFYMENENLYTREEVLQSLLSVTDVVEDAFNEDMQVHLYDNTAIVTGWLYINGKSSGTSFKRKYRYTDIWLKKNGEWQIIAAQDYLLP